jgi:protein-S-isoprenylcysteine O-methyltransferase Ste14
LAGRVLFSVTLAAWVLLELGLRIRETAQGRGHVGHDQFTRVMIAVSLGAAVGLAFGTSHSQSLPMPEAFRVAGLVVIWLGLAIRLWAIATLGRAFRTTVEVDPGQTVVTSGPYRAIRHPSYTGLLLIVAGIGLAAENWLGLAACLVLPLPAVLWRMRVEEAELTRVLGDPYRRYVAVTKRLIPGVW